MHQRALRIPEKLLTSRRSSPAPSSSLRSGRPPRRSAAGPGWRFVRLRWRHPAFGSPSESNPPFPGSPSLRSQREEFPPSVYMLSLLFLSRAQSRAALDYFFFFSTYRFLPRSVRSPQIGLSTALLSKRHRGGGWSRLFPQEILAILQVYR